MERNRGNRAIRAISFHSCLVENGIIELEKRGGERDSTTTYIYSFTHVTTAKGFGIALWGSVSLRLSGLPARRASVCDVHVWGSPEIRQWNKISRIIYVMGDRDEIEKNSTI